MRHINTPLKIYKNEHLMREFNRLLIEIKVQIYGNDELKMRHHKPTVQEIDMMTNRIMAVLQEDSIEMKKY